MITNFQEFLNENDGGGAPAATGSGGAAFSTMANTGGMGAVVAPQPGTIPGSFGTPGSGDIANGSFGPYIKPYNNTLRKRKLKKKKKSQKKEKENS